MVTNNAEALLSGTLAGLGIAHLPTWLISDHLLRGELLPLFCEHGLPTPEASGIYALRLTREADSRSRLLLEFLKSRFGPVPPWDQALQSGLRFGCRRLQIRQRNPRAPALRPTIGRAS